MKKTMIILGMPVFLIFASVSWAAPDTTENPRQITPLTNLGTNYLDSLTGINFLFHAGGVAATYGIIQSGVDYKVHNYFSKNEEKINMYTVPAVYIGYAGPLLLGGGMFLSGYLNDNTKTAAAGCAVLQASFIAWSWTSLLKTFTGRPNPDAYTYTDKTDQSGKFKFGFMRNGIHYGWPSGHLGVSTAVISCLAAFYNDSPVIQAVSWSVWAYMFIGVIAHEGNTMHWTSDVVAGSMMGFAIGSTVGRNFRETWAKGNSGKESGYSFDPSFGGNFIGLNIDYTF
jgi:hypothetical protein